MKCLVCTAALLALLVVLSSQHTIKHVVILMEENRSFDHLLGFLKNENPEIQGLTGKESNPYNVSEPHGRSITVTSDAPYVAPWDPCHSLPCVTDQIFGDAKGDKVTMNGFVANAVASNKGVEPNNVMRMFTPSRLPVLSTLAREYAVFDQWFCSVPGPTYPNRRFLHAATSYGSLNNDNYYKPGFPVKTIYNQVVEANLTTGIYFFDHSPYCDFETLRTPELSRIFHHIDQFYIDAKEGNLPNYTYLNPRFFPTHTTPSNDQHPDHSVLLGEALIKSVYEALRSSPLWNDTLFIITYDEHGGFYDHMPTPTEGIPNPDGRVDPEFNFTRLGIRVPTVMVSPWINKGTVMHGPSPQNKPHPNSEFEHSSVLATMKKLFGFPTFLSKRQEWAGTFEDVYSQRKEVRTDCFEKLPDLDLTEEEMIRLAKEEMQLPVNGLQKEILVSQQCTAPTFLNPEHFDYLTQGEAAAIMQQRIFLFIFTKRNKEIPKNTTTYTNFVHGFGCRKQNGTKLGVAVAVQTALGFAWYGPLFGKQLGFVQEDNKDTCSTTQYTKGILMSVAGAVFMNAPLIYLLNNLSFNNLRVHTPVQAVSTAGLVVSATLGCNLLHAFWEGKSCKVMFLNELYHAVSLSLNAFIVYNFLKR